MRTGLGVQLETLLPPFLMPFPRSCLCRVTAVAREHFEQKADTTAKVEAHARFCSLINGSAHALSSSWLFLLSGEATTPTAASGVEAVSGSAIGDVLYTPAARVSSDATRTVPIVAVRRLAHTCGIVRSSAGGPTLAHVDMQLRRNTIGKGRLGYREVRGYSGANRSGNDIFGRRQSHLCRTFRSSHSKTSTW